MRQLAFLESSGNKKAKAFFRSHGILGPVDYTSQLAERWRNELAEAVLEMYPKKNQTEFGHTHSIAKAPVPEIIQRVEENKIEKETKIEEQKEPEKIVAVQPIVSRSTFKVQATEVKHKFKKSKAPEETQGVSFKPVIFKPQNDEEEFFDPQPLKPPVKQKEILPTPAPVPIQRKAVEKKGISSDDFEMRYIDEKANKARIAQLSSANAISSDMYFGREEAQNSEISTERIKEEASRIGALALDKAIQVRLM